MKKTTVVEEYEYAGFGFPVVLKNVEIVTNGSYRYADVKHKKLEKKVLLKIAKSDQALTGAQLKYIRQYLGYSIRGFANLLGVKHPTILKWQDRMQERTGMNYGTEILVKSALLIELSKTEKSFYTNYTKIMSRHGKRKDPETYITI